MLKKPLALNQEELDQVIKVYNEQKNPTLTVGFNRRFSPHLEAVKESLNYNKEPINLIVTMNAGFIPKSLGS